MKNTLKISLKANEKIYVNGAVIKTDRKVSLEFLNDVQFLLQSHVLQIEDASSPLRQLYFIVQIMLMDPQGAEQARTAFRATLPRLLDAFSDERILSALKYVDRLVAEDQVFEALKAIRGLYPIEDQILSPGAGSETAPRATAVGE
jgi:flagellar protein FlbT